MELFGLLLAILLTGFISVIYSGGMTFLLHRARWLRWPILTLSGIIAANLGAELILLFSIGAKHAYSLFGLGFTIMHETNFFLASASVANFILVAFTFWTGDKWSKWGFSFLSTIPICWFMCMAMLIGNISVDEAIVGVNASQPFWMTKP
jgi:hypothetical protein